MCVLMFSRINKRRYSLLQILREICHNNPTLKNCSCALSYILPNDDGTSFQPMYSVNCSYLNLKHLPNYIPENTTIFYATNNQVKCLQSQIKIIDRTFICITIIFVHLQITSLEPLRSIYRLVHDIYLDYNQIQSIEVLESFDWLENFRVFSLKGNYLTKV